MDAEADVHEGAGESSSFGTLELAREPRTECIFSASTELSEEMPEIPGQSYQSSMEMTPEVGRETYALRPGIEFSTDLRMELSADVLASLGGSSNGVEKPPEDSLMEITSMREDMHFIREISLSPPPDRGNSSDRGNFTSVGTSPQTEADSGSYARVGSLSSEAQYHCSVPASTVSGSLVSAQVDPALGDSTNEYPNPPASVFENPASTPVEPPVDMVAFAASLSFPVTAIATGTTEADGCSQYDASLVSLGTNHDPSGGSVLNPVSVALDDESTDRAAIPLPVLDASNVGDEVSTSKERDGVTTSVTKLDVASADGQGLMLPSDSMKSSVTMGISSPGEVPPQIEDVATVSSQSQFGHALPPVTGGGGGDLRSPSLLLEVSNVAYEERPVGSAHPSDLQNVPALSATDSAAGSCPLVPTHSQFQSSIVAETELASLKPEQLCTPAEPASVPPTVIHVEPSSGFAQDPLGTEGELQRTILDGIVLPASLSAPFQVPSLPSPTEASEDARLALLHAPDQFVPLSAPVHVPEMNPTLDVARLSSPSVSFPAPSGIMCQQLDGATSASGTDIVQSTPMPSDSIPAKSDAAARVEPFSFSAKTHPGESETALLSAGPGQFWDEPSSSVRSLPSLATLSAYFDGSRSPFRGRKTARRKKSSESVVDGKGKNSSEVEKMEEVVELESMVEAQKKAMQWQIDELQRVMVTQCQLTGRNPLSEEMVYEVLGEKIAEKGSSERPSAEAVRHMKEVFAIKDTITKKEAREISSMTGATISQVQDFFTAQTILVKKLVQQAIDQSGRVGIRNATDQSSNATFSNSIGVERDPGFQKLTSVESLERFLELMRAERSFFGQLQLMQIILQTDATALILRRFLEKGGLKILGQWLVEAAAEEQTSVLRQLLKALAHLPISNSVAHQMPTVVQNVNKLRFYHNLDASAQARSLLSKWSKMLKQKAETVKPSGSVANKPTSVLEKNIASAPGGPKRNRDVLPLTQGGSGPRKKKAKEEESSQPESKASGVSTPGSPLLSISTPGVVDTTPPVQPTGATPPPAKQRWSTTLQPSESAVAAVSVSRKRVASKSLGDHAKERRKVQLVEDTSAGKSLSSGVASKSTISKNSRPLSTDDIYRAKKLQRLMQEPITKSRKKGATQDVDQQAAAKKDFLPAQQLDVSRGLHENTAPIERSSGYRQTVPFAASTERNDASKWTSLVGRPQQEPYQPSITPTSSPDRGPRIITPTSSPDRPELIITPTSTPDRPQDAEKPTSPQGPSEIVVKPLSPEDRQERLDASTSDSSQELLQPATVVDTSTLNSYKLNPSLTSGLIADGSQVISPYSSNLGLIEAVTRSELPQQPAEVIGPGLSPVYKERIGVSDPPAGSEVLRPAESIPGDNLMSANPSNIQPAFVEPTQLSGSVRKQHLPQIEPQLQAAGVQMYSIPSPTPPEEIEVTEVKQTDDSLNPRIPAEELPMVDFYAALRANMIRWRIPPVYYLDSQWNVAAGEDSKEKEVQSARVKREEEAYYPDASSIPSNPKDPWEEEPSYDDSLTFEIYLDNSQRKSAPGNQVVTDHMTAPAMMPSGIAANSFKTEASDSMFSGYTAPDPSGDISRKGPSANGLDLLLQQLSASGGVAHDPALLSLLLQNPDLVNQLTSGQGYTRNVMTSTNVIAPHLDQLKQPNNIGNLGAGLRSQTADIGLDRFGASNIPVPMLTETMRVEDSPLKHPHTGMGHQQNPGLTPQAGVDNRYSAPPQMQTPVGSTSGWEQARMAPPLPPLPPPPPLPPIPNGSNQVLQQSVQSQANKVTNWPDPQAWNSVGAVVGRPPVNTAQIHSGQEQLHMRPQTIMTPNVRPPNYGGMVGLPQVEVNTVVSQQEMHNAGQRQWSNGSHLVIAPSANDNAMIQAGQDSGVGRNSRWPRPPGLPGPPPPSDPQLRPIGREYPDFPSSRQASVAENLGVWVPNDRGRPGPPPFQGAYRPPPPPPPPPYPAPQQWHQTPERNVRPGPASAVPPFPLGRDLRPQQPQPPQPWHPSMGPPRPLWRGPQ